MSEDFNYYFTDGIINVYPENSNDLDDVEFFQVDSMCVIEEVDQVEQVNSGTEMITISSEGLGSRLAECLGLLKKRVLHLREEGPLSLRKIKFQGYWEPGEKLVEPLAWDALADLVICLPSLELAFLGQFRSSDLPPSFVLRLRQHAVDLELNFRGDDEPDIFLSLLSEQAQQLHSPSISPFAIRSLIFISADNIASLVNLGRAGPERAVVVGRGVIEWRDNSVATLVVLLEKNLWLEWDNRGRYGSWFAKPPSEGEEDPVGAVAAFESAELELSHRLHTVSRRNRELRETTRAAATALLREARPLLLALPLSLLDNVAPSSPSASNLASLPSQLPSLSLPLSQNQNHPPSLTAASRFPPNFSSLLSSTSFPSILSLPYEILDLILSHLSPGHLSFNQHRLVMNWAEDRATLGARKADSRTDFLRKTNCWRWESEIERVNMGLGYE